MSTIATLLPENGTSMTVPAQQQSIISSSSPRVTKLAIAFIACICIIISIIEVFAIALKPESTGADIKKALLALTGAASVWPGNETMTST